MVELRPRTAKGTVASRANDPTVRKSADDDIADGSTRADTAAQVTKLPTPLQFPIVTVLSLALSSLGYALLGAVTQGDLAAVARSTDDLQDVAILTGWRILVLGIGWFGKLDSYDLAALNILSHGPCLYLLVTFYGVSATSALSALVIDALATSIPFQLLRPVASAHTAPEDAPNQEIVADPAIQVYTASLSAVIYGATLLGALKTFLPRVLVIHFSTIKTLIPAYNATWVTVAPAAVLAGFTARVFVFTPFAATPKKAEDAKLSEFDPAAATLSETAAYNLWGYTAKAKVGILRTVVVAVVTYVDTYLQCTKVVDGVESEGARVYAMVWAAAALFSGLGLGLVGRT
ncbi:hypothetical protein jhhlp_006916 [Lomentospora prolificans]|uniref:Uncharacterized protein n=1 Tax=Lomentospora prolificans TaxID=41688 RepID=A0A2N3N332_9PEZI|nr:hypothetical protein jhhlp_006916 [Lomentospora prolificans]